MTSSVQEVNAAYRVITPLLTGVSLLTTLMILIFLDPRQPEPKFDCQARIKAKLTSHQARLLIGKEPSQRNIKEWCSHTPEAKLLIARARRYPRFPAYVVGGEK